MLRPLEDKVIIEIKKETEKTTSSGLVLASLQEEKPTEGVVVAVGPGITLQDGTHVAPDFEVGDTVIYSKYSGTEITHDGKDYLIITLRDVFAVIGDKEIN